MPQIIVVLHNIRSTHNVGSIWRTCEGLGVERIICSGFTAYPQTDNDPRLPHIADKLTAQIHKTALGAETMVPFDHMEEFNPSRLIADGYRIVGLELTPSSIPLRSYDVPPKIALVLGEEVSGISDEMLMMCDDTIEIPMRGEKESFNVSVAAGIALYALTTAS